MITQMNWNRIHIVQDNFFELNEELCTHKEALENNKNVQEKNDATERNIRQLKRKIQHDKRKIKQYKNECDALKLKVGYKSSDEECSDLDMYIS